MPSSRVNPSRTQSRPSRAVPARDPRVEAIYVELELLAHVDRGAAIRSLLRRAGLTTWRVAPAVQDWTEVELLPRRSVSPRVAWDASYALRRQSEVVHAEPMFRYLTPENTEPRIRTRSGSRAVHDPATDTEYDWSLRKANVLDAWRLFGTVRPGEGVKIGHPDTGYTPHPELADTARLLIADGYDYEDDDADPLDELADGTLDNPGHGTSTGSVILSGVGEAPGGHGPFVSGAAPHALLVPIRTTESVVLFSMRGLRRAIDHARAAGVSVISMSLGGPFEGFGTRRAIQRALDAGIIVVAAAGNHVGFVVYPAAFEEPIAVAASNINDEPWSESSRGKAVDITAPGESVWRARSVRSTDGELTFLVERGSGTSYATATMAGVAALWVSYHGRPLLVQRYGEGNIARVFKELLLQACRTPRGWDREHYGPGIVDAKALLAAPLPVTPVARKLRDPRRSAVAADATGLEALVHLFPESPRTKVESLLAGLLNVRDRELPQTLQAFGEELSFHLVMNPALLAEARQYAAGMRARKAAADASLRRRVASAGVSRPLARQLQG